MPHAPAPKPYDLEAELARTTPAVLALLGDGVARTRREIVAALAEHHPKEDVKRTLMRLAVTGRLISTGSRYGLASDGRERNDGPAS